MTQQFEVGMHPYLWRITVEFGTLQEMLDNAIPRGSTWTEDISLGGNFNPRMQAGNKVPLFNIGVRITPIPHPWHKPKAEDVESVEGICMSPWRGDNWPTDIFNEAIVRGLYPVKANWDGRTFVEKGSYGTDGKYMPRYAETETWHYI
jgi:hypothetical protein